MWCVHGVEKLFILQPHVQISFVIEFHEGVNVGLVYLPLVICKWTMFFRSLSVLEQVM